MVAEQERTRGVTGGQDVSVTYLEYDGVKKPVYDFRNLDHQEVVARKIANGAQVAMFFGVWAGFKAVDADVEEEPFFYVAKPGRPKEAKIVVITHPETSHKLVDWSEVHPDFRFLEDLESFESLWDNHGAALHVIVPIKEGIDFPKLFVTSPQEYATRYPNHAPIAAPTVSVFWRKDKYLEHLLSRVGETSERPIFIGGTSLNRHGEDPPFTYGEFIKHLNDHKVDPGAIDLVVRDSIDEGSGAHGSHTQIRVPLVGEKEPILRVYRIGTLSPEGFERATGIETRVMPDAKDVRRFPGVNIDQRIKATHERIHAQWQQMSGSITSSM